MARVYYTGDVANQPGWFTVAPEAQGGHVVLVEDAGGEGRRFTLSAGHIGDVYQGHCNPRFVTEDAYLAYHQERAAAAVKRIGRRVRRQEG
jgi:hypothetical protein